MECGTCGKPEGKRKDRRFIVNKTRQIGVGMTTNNSGRGRGSETGMNTVNKLETGPHTCQEELGSVLFDIMDKGALYMWD
jgi:hypothetical protein